MVRCGLGNRTCDHNITLNHVLLLYRYIYIKWVETCTGTFIEIDNDFKIHFHVGYSLGKKRPYMVAVTENALNNLQLLKFWLSNLTLPLSPTSPRSIWKELGKNMNIKCKQTIQSTLWGFPKNKPILEFRGSPNYIEAVTSKLKKVRKLNLTFIFRGILFVGKSNLCIHPCCRIGTGNYHLDSLHHPQREVDWCKCACVFVIHHHMCDYSLSRIPIQTNRHRLAEYNLKVLMWVECSS